MDDDTIAIDPRLAGVYLPVLTVWQPWCNALLRGGKDVENRPWAWHYTGWVLAHAGRQVDEEALEHVHHPSTPRGVIIGAIYKTGLTRCSASWWAVPGQWHHLYDPDAAVSFDEPIPHRGMPGVPSAPRRVLAALPAPFIERVALGR